MRIPDLIRNVRKPPPESLVGYMTLYEGRFMRNMPFFILINLAWKLQVMPGEFLKRGPAV